MAKKAPRHAEETLDPDIPPKLYVRFCDDEEKIKKLLQDTRKLLVAVEDDEDRRILRSSHRALVGMRTGVRRVKAILSVVIR